MCSLAALSSDAPRGLCANWGDYPKQSPNQSAAKIKSKRLFGTASQLLEDLLNKATKNLKKKKKKKSAVGERSNVNVTPNGDSALYKNSLPLRKGQKKKLIPVDKTDDILPRPRQRKYL